MQTPIVFLIFNRPYSTGKVFEAIQKVKPRKLFIVADGPRLHKTGESEQCSAARKIAQKVDWDCEIHTNYSDINLGCKNRISSGLDWVFKNEDKAIILEDDCVPDLTFFRFCEELLEFHKSDENIFSICGQNSQFGRKRTSNSYYFSKYFHCWGWATWRRAWQTYDVSINYWPDIRDKGFLEEVLADNGAVMYWTKIFDRVYKGEVDTWDYQWILASWIHKGFAVIPDVNLISNIGFGVDASHTSNSSETTIYADMKTHPIIFPLRHPEKVLVNKYADEFVQKTLFDPGFFNRAKMKINRELGIRRI